jgi:hypothetical protein
MILIVALVILFTMAVVVALSTIPDLKSAVAMVVVIGIPFHYVLTFLLNA